MIQIGLVDDQELIRQGIAKLIDLNEELKIEWQVSNGNEALQQLSQGVNVDIIIADIRMPEMNGIELIYALKKNHVDIPMLMLTTFDDHELFMQAVKAGAKGFLLKDVNLDKLTNAIKIVAEGGFLAEPIFLNQDSLKTQHSHFLKTQSHHFSETLIDKEIQVLRLMAGGLNNREISQILHLAEGTIKNYVSQVLSKMDCRDRTQAVVKAIKWGII